MKHWRTTLAWLLALWLPLQGFAASQMTVCEMRHAGETAAAEHHDHGAMAHAHDAHRDHLQAQPAPAELAADLDPHNHFCDGCSLCQHCTAATLPGSYTLPLSIPASEPVTAPANRIASFIPPLPQRPPRLARA